MDERTVREGASQGRLGTPLMPEQPRSILPKGMREKLIVAFALMSVVPLLVLGYIVTNYVFPHVDSALDLSILVGLAVMIAFLGFIVARNLVLPVIQLSTEVQEIAKGNLERRVEVRAPDEIGALGSALNQITARVRENIEQLKTYGEQTKNLNLEINRRILAFSHLLQVSNLITQSAKVEEVIGFILERLSQQEEAELNCLLEPAPDENAFVIRAAMGSHPEQVQALLKTKLVAPWLARTMKENRILVIDGEPAKGHEGELLQELFGMTNAICQPLVSIGQGVGMLICANRKSEFTFSEDSIELYKVFAKQMAIAIENDLLVKRAEELKVIDELTGLYNETYMKSRLDEEVRRAIRYHRPCSLVILNLDNYRQFTDLYGGLAAEGTLRQVAEILKSKASEVDRVGRISDDEFALVLPERNKREAIELAEAIRRQIEQTVFKNGPQQLPCTVTASSGVSENPIDGATGQELFDKAVSSVKAAKIQGKNRVVAN